MSLASMTTQSPDTDADAERLQIRILRAMPVWERIAQIDALNAVAEAFAVAGLRRAHQGVAESRLLELVRDQRLRSAAASPRASRPDRGAGGTP
jgi:hypothetical protein